LRFNEVVARYLEAVGERREVVRDPEALGSRVEEHSLVPLTLLGRADQIIGNFGFTGFTLLHLLRTAVGTTRTRAHWIACPQPAKADIASKKLKTIYLKSNRPQS
jgi:hypothetical protein